MASATLIFNPKAGAGDRREFLPEILRIAARAGIRLRACPTPGPGEGTDLARRAVRDGSERVLAWGGDGTLNEVANGLIGSEVPMGILPGGSVNLLAREIGIPLDLAAAAETALRGGKPRKIGVGRAGRRHFLLMAGFGLDAYLIRKTPVDLKPYLGRYAYIVGALQHIWSYRFPALRVQFSGKSLLARQAVIANISHYGGTYRLAPLAAPAREELTLFLFQGRRVRDYIRYLWGIRLGRHAVYRDVLNFQWDSFQVLGAPEPVEMQLDGDYIGRAAAHEVVKVPDALTIIS